MGIRVNFSDVETTNYEAIPAGTYAVKITGGEIRESGENAKHPGSQYINWEFTVQEGEYQGRKLWSNTSLRQEALFALKGMLEATGKFNVDDDLDFEIEDCIGADLKAVVKTKTYNGDLQNEIKRFKSLNSEDDKGSNLLP